MLAIAAIVAVGSSSLGETPKEATHSGPTGVAYLAPVGPPKGPSDAALDALERMRYAESEAVAAWWGQRHAESVDESISVDSLQPVRIRPAAFPLREHDPLYAYIYDPGWVLPAPVPVPVPYSQVGVAQTAGVEQWRGLVAQYFHAVDYALRVMRCESGGNHLAHNNNPASHDDSVGLFQINLYGDLLAPRAAKLREWGYPANDRASTIAVLQDPEANVRFAAHMSGGGASFAAWSCG